MPSNTPKDFKSNAGKARPLPRLVSLPPAFFFAPDVEREINRLEGVTSAKVISTGSAIDEIHVVAPKHRQPKKIVRDIESLLMVRFGIHVDHRCISVVQMDGMLTTYPRDSRPQIQRVSRDNQVVRLYLGVADDIIIGEAKFSSDGEALEAAGHATIHAIEQIIQSPGVLKLVEARVAELHEHRVLIVLVRWAYAEQQELLTGTSLIHGDPLEAIARATLDAVNRRLVRFQSLQA
jgi:hypothetical protein